MRCFAPGSRMFAARSGWLGGRRSRVLGVAGVTIATLIAAGSVPAPSGASGSASTGGTVDPAAEVNPFIGTGVGAGSTGAIGDFPGADVPFGMVQWSPDTPTTSMTDAVSGGYFYTLDTIDGFSLTHLSGAGCPVLEDFPVIPFPGTLTTSPAADPCTHEHVLAPLRDRNPGSYEVALGDGVKVALTVTDRTGLAPSPSRQGSPRRSLSTPRRATAGFTNGRCRSRETTAFPGRQWPESSAARPATYSAHLAAKFETPFRSFGTWEGGRR